MNLNENIGRGRKNRSTLPNRNYTVKTNTLYPSTQGPSTSRRNKTAAGTSSTSSDINFGQHNRLFNNSSLVTGSTTRTSENESRVVLALTEGRGEARCEVGIATMNIYQPFLIVCQISDSHSYINTLTKINILNPNEILVPIPIYDASPPNRLVEKIKQQFPNIKLTGYARQAFNKAQGIQRITEVCLSSHNSVLLMLQHKYYALSAAAALFFYAESNLYQYYAKESIKVEYQESEGAMIIDILTADKLELVSCARPSAVTSKYSSLFGVLNYCITRIGGRTLRCTILQPSCSVPDIESKLDCVQELIKYPEMLSGIQALLRNLVNVDQLLTLGALLPDSPDNCSERQLNYLLLVNVTLEQILPLQNVFEDTELPFFVELNQVLGSEEFNSVKTILHKVILPDAHPAKGSNATMQRCFAIKQDVSGLLDVMRKTFSEVLEEMREYVKSLAEKYGLPLVLNNNTKKGYHIVFPLTKQQKRTLKKSDLPQEFIQVYRLAGSYTMKTPELQNYSVRLDDMLDEILKLSNYVIFNTLIEIRSYATLFYALVEHIAKLDVLQSLAQASAGNRYVRPIFGSYLDMSHSKHPMLDFLCKKEPVANPVQASKEYNMHIITGPNGSGKSIYIRQIALIHIMAQIGCYVPATAAVLRVADRLFARIGLDDNMECGASTFEVEMREVKYFLTDITKNSLLIIDELGRSTSLEEGTALSLAISEKLMRTEAFIFLTTHFTLITKLQDMYFNVKVWQLEAIASGTSVKDTKLSLKYNLLPGCTTLRRYSVYLVRKLWPEAIINDISELLDEISENTEVTAEAANAIARLVYDIEAELKHLKCKQKLTKAVINTTLNKYMCDIQKYGIKVAENISSSESSSGNLIYLADRNNDVMQNLSITEKEVAEFRVPIHNRTNHVVQQQPEIDFLEYPNTQIDDGNSIIDYELYDDFINENSGNLNMLIPHVSLCIDSSFKSLPSACASIAGMSQKSANNNTSLFEIPAKARNPFAALISDSPIKRKLVFYDDSSQSSYASFGGNEIGVSPIKPKMFNLQPKQKRNKDNSSLINDTTFARPLQMNADRTSTPMMKGASKKPFNTNQSCFSRRKSSNNLGIIAENTKDKSESHPDPEISSILEELETCDEFFSDWDASATSKQEDAMESFTTDKSKKPSTAMEWNKTYEVKDDTSNQNKIVAKHLPCHVLDKSESKENNLSTTFDSCINSMSKQTSSRELNTSLINNATTTNDANMTSHNSTVVRSSFDPGSISYSPLCSSPSRSNSEIAKLLELNELLDKDMQHDQVNDGSEISNTALPTDADNVTKSDCEKQNISPGVSETCNEPSSSLTAKTCYIRNASSSSNTDMQPDRVNERSEPLKTALPTDVENITKSDCDKQNCSSEVSETCNEPSSSLTVKTCYIRDASSSSNTDMQPDQVNECSELSKTAFPIDAENITNSDCEKQNTSSEVYKRDASSRSNSQKNSSSTAKSTCSTKRRQTKTKKFKAPLLFDNMKTKTAEKDSSNGTSTSSTETQRKRTMKTSSVARFKPPKITKKQIQTEFNEQDRRMMENANASNASEYAQRLMNRPSVRQFQEREHIALIRKTEHGVVVIPAEKKKPRKCLGLPLGIGSAGKSRINVSIFSDRNADKFEEFMQNKGMASFMKRSRSFCFGEDQNYCDKDLFSGVPIPVKKVRKEEQTVNINRPRENTNPSNLDLFSQSNMSQSSVSKYLSLTPDGYYKDNKSQINNIIGKYLGAEDTKVPEIRPSMFKIWTSDDDAIFNSPQ